MGEITKGVAGIAAILCWIAGMVIAKGFWSTFFAVIPLYAWYLVVEKVMIAQGWA